MFMFNAQGATEADQRAKLALVVETAREYWDAA